MSRFSSFLTFALVAVCLLQTAIAAVTTPTPSSPSIPSPPPVGSDDWLPASHEKPENGTDEVEAVTRYSTAEGDVAPVKMFEHRVIEDSSDVVPDHKSSKTLADAPGGSVVRADLKTSTRIYYGRFYFSSMTRRVCANVRTTVLYARYAPLPGYSASCYGKVRYFSSYLCVSPVCKCVVEYWRA